MSESPRPERIESIVRTPMFAEGVPFARPVALPPPAPSSPLIDEMLLATASVRSVWFDVAALALLLIACELIVEAAFGIALESPPAPDEPLADESEMALTRVMLLPTLTMRAVASVGVILLILRNRGQSIRSVGIMARPLAWNLLIGVGAAVASYLLMWVLFPLLWLIWPDVFDQMRENAERLTGLVPRMHPTGFAIVATLVGVYEELIFRGFLMTRLRRGTGSWTLAVLISTAVFTVLHAMDQTAAALVWISILGLVFSIATIWRRSLVPAIVGHALFDWSQFLFLSWQTGESWA